jgi:hypothetical protein
VSTNESSPDFPSIESAVNALAEFARGFEFPCVDLDPSTIARESAQSAFLKALTRRLPGSAEAYSLWALESVPKMAKGARYVINQEQMDLLVRRTGLGLLRAWRAFSADRCSRLSFGAAFRIVDSLFKAIDESESCRFDSVRPFLHVPLDRSTLGPIRRIVDALAERDFAFEIPSTVSSGFVATEEQYVLLQGAISELARRAGVPPILFAYFCEGL